MTQQKFFRNYFRGAFLNLFQFSSNMAHPLYYSRSNGYFTHFLFSSLFELVTFPLDTVKTRLWADVNRNYKNAFDCIQKTYEQHGFTNFYNGVLFKLIFNALLILNLRSMYEDNCLQ